MGSNMKRVAQNIIGDSQRKTNVYQFNNPNLQQFKKTLKFITDLHKSKLINDDDLHDLTVHVCSLFIENEIDKRFRKFFDSKFTSILDKL